MNNQFPNLKTKKAIIFIGLKHHYKKLEYLFSFLKRQGMELQFITTRNIPSLGSGNRECFELFLMENNIHYTHLYEYRDELSHNNCERQKKNVWNLIKAEMLTSGAEFLQSIPFNEFEDTINDACECYELFKIMIDTEKPDIVLGLHEVNFWVKLLCQATEGSDIPIFTFQEGLYTKSENRTEKYQIIADYSTVALWGEESYNTIKIMNVLQEDNLKLVGNSEYDCLFQHVITEDLNIKKKFGIPEETKVLLLLMPNP